MSKDKPEVVRQGCLNVQVCVPEEWTDEQAELLANGEYPAGTTCGWRVRKDPKRLVGDPERNPCPRKKGYVHIMMDC